MFKPQNPTVAGRMSLKGALPKNGEERTNLRDEPFIAQGAEEESKQPRQAAANNQTAAPAGQAAAGNEVKAEGAGTTASKEPILGLDSNNNQNQNKVPLKTID